MFFLYFLVSSNVICLYLVIQHYRETTSAVPGNKCNSCAQIKGNVKMKH